MIHTLFPEMHAALYRFGVVCHVAVQQKPFFAASPSLRCDIAD
jgi:hypothetical protein